MTYSQRLSNRIAATGSHLCVGIDPRLDRMDGDLEATLTRLVEETTEVAACFKPNIAYFEALGSSGYALLERLLDRIPPELPVILDAKRGDIGATQQYYAKAYFETMARVDAVTINPYMGFDAIEPFLEYPGKAVYLLGVTSNAGAADLEMRRLADGRHVFELVGDMVRRAADHKGEAGLVVGLTNVSAEIAASLPDVPLLLPGLGAQGGDVAELGALGGAAPFVVNVSRGILLAEDGFAASAARFRDQIQTVIG